MRKINKPAVSLLVVVLLIGGIAALVLATNGAGETTTQAPTTAGPPGTSGTQSTAASASQPGEPAITPTQKGVPAFTVADVRQYLATHAFPGGPTVSGAPSTIVQIVFITSKQASELMQGESIGLPDKALVCYVELHGPFLLTKAHTPPGQPTPVAPNGELVFDAQTGNLLLWGGKS